ncbi:hypothetical protein ACLSY0_06720 [Avibacterium avium]|uniref:hypothetical protein n=1 Tax=Avibacterium avium TaxID=751 RepID=UPI003BF83073
MTKPILYFAHWCPDTEPFVKELQRLGVEYHAIDITLSGANFKQFLKLRDHHSAFDNAKVNGNIGIPALLIDEQVILDVHQLQDLD